MLWMICLLHFGTLDPADPNPKGYASSTQRLSAAHSRGPFFESLGLFIPTPFVYKSGQTHRIDKDSYFVSIPYSPLRSRFMLISLYFC